MLVSGLEYLDEPRELERIASPFGGGMGMGAHCGFYTAGLMVIGLASAGNPEGKASALKLRQAFTEEWKKKWPFLCKEIKEGQSAGKIAGNCGTLGAESGAVLGGLLAPIAGDPRRARFARKA